MDPKWPEFEIGKIQVLNPPEIGTLGTPGMSHGTKKIIQKISHVIKIRSYMMHFVDMFYENCRNNEKTGFSLVNKEMSIKWEKTACFSSFLTIFTKHSHKMHYIWSDFHHMRNFLTKFFWSHGTSLGSPGSLSQGDVLPGFCRFQILVIWGPYESPVLVACPRHSKSPKTAGARCGHKSTDLSQRLPPNLHPNNLQITTLLIFFS